MTQSKSKYLLNNTILFAISSFGTKLLHFFLVPLYTNVLTTAEYGISDLILTIVSLSAFIFTLDISSSTLRFAIDDKDNPQKVLWFSIKVHSIGSLVFLAFVFGIYYFNVLRWEPYCYFFLFITFVSSTLYSILSNYLRAIDKIKEVVIIGLFSSLLVVLFNILFLLIFKLGIIGYLISNILASLLVSLCCLFIIRPKWEKREKNDKELGRAMLAYSIPLIFNGVCWWANTSLDKFFIKYMLGDAQNGLYAVGTKIPGLLTLFQTIFNQAWTLSAIREFDKEDKDGFFSNIYRWYNAGITICCSFLIVFNYSFAKILYAKDFFEAWRISSILTLTIMFSGLSGIVGSVFSAVKNSRAYATSTIVAAVANAILNYFFINWLGIQGAAVSTVISFVIIWAIRLKLSQQYINMHFRLGRDIFTYIMLFLQVSLEQVIDHSSIHFYLIQGSVFLVIIIAYRGELQIITNRLFALVGGLVRENK